MGETQVVNKIVVNLPKEKIDFINQTHAKEIEYLKNVAFDNKNEEERMQLTNVATLKVSLYRKKSVKEVKIVNEILCYLKNKYLPHNEEQEAYIGDIPSKEEQLTFETISDSIKIFSKSIAEVENTNLKNKALLGGWISIAAKVFRHEKNIRGENLPDRFEDWLYREHGMKKQMSYNYKHLYRLMKIAPKLMNCRVNRTYFVLNHDILFNYFKEENEEQPWKHSVPCNCEVCSSYFAEQIITF